MKPMEVAKEATSTSNVKAPPISMARNVFPLYSLISYISCKIGKQPRKFNFVQRPPESPLDFPGLSGQFCK